MQIISFIMYCNFFYFSAMGAEVVLHTMNLMQKVRRFVVNMEAQFVKYLQVWILFDSGSRLTVNVSSIKCTSVVICVVEISLTISWIKTSNIRHLDL